MERLPHNSTIDRAIFIIFSSYNPLQIRLYPTRLDCIMYFLFKVMDISRGIIISKKTKYFQVFLGFVLTQSLTVIPRR